MEKSNFRRWKGKVSARERKSRSVNTLIERPNGNELVRRSSGLCGNRRTAHSERTQCQISEIALNRCENGANIRRRANIRLQWRIACCLQSATDAVAVVLRPHSLAASVEVNNVDR